MVARAILGEWLGGSGGGWQDSGGIFPGIKLIEGVAAAEGDPEWGVSRGRLLPAHHLLGKPAVPAGPPAGAKPADPFPEALARSLVLVHGGMAQNVGPILNMVTAKYLLRGQEEWLARLESLRIFDQILAAVGAADACAPRRLDDAELGGTAQASDPLGHERIYRVDHQRGTQRCWGRISGDS